MERRRWPALGPPRILPLLCCRFFVLEAGPELKMLAVNKLDDSFRSSVAIAPRQVLFRGVDRIYSVSE